MEKKVDFFKDSKMFCPNCRKKVDPIINHDFKALIRKKAKEFANRRSFERIIIEKDYNTLQKIIEFKQLEDNCKFCPICKWSPFQNKIGENLLREFRKQFSEDIKQVEGDYLLDCFNPSNKASHPKKTILDLFKKLL